MSLMLPPGGLVVLFLVLEHRVDVRAVLEDVPETPTSDPVQHAHVADTNTVRLPPVNPVDEVVKELLGDGLQESHHRLPIPADQASVQQLQVRVRLEKVLDLVVRMVGEHPLVDRKSTRLNSSH